MLTLAQFDLPALAVALLIGIATGGWIFRGVPRRHESEDEVPS